MSNKADAKKVKGAETAGLVPRLRFPEFRGAGGWQRNQLCELAKDFLDGDWIESKDQSNVGIRLLQTGNIGVGTFISKIGNSRYISDETFTRLHCEEVFPGDCLISRLPDPAGRSCLVPDIGQRMITAVDCTIARFDKKRIIPYLFVAYSQTDQYFREVEALCSGSTRQRISRETLSRIKVALPKLGEQQKIADCLSSLDEAITLESKKLDALKVHKKGLMQQLFPAEGETVPRLRFPEFRGAGEWEVKPIGSVCEVLNNRRKPVSSSGREKGEYPYYGASGIVDYVRDYIFDERLLLVGEDGAKWGSFEKTAFIADGKYWVNNHAHVLRPIDASDTLLENYLTMVDIGPYVTGAAPPKLTLGKLKGINVCLPPLMEEQQKIADCLSSLDEVITLESQKLEALKVHKKGLMQQLFPKLEEV